jgi:hypothetical protein
MEDNLNFSGNRKMILISEYGRGSQFSGYGKGPQSLRKWKMTSSFQEI